MTTLRSRIFIIFSIALLLVLAISIILIVINKQKKAAEGPAVGVPATTIDADNFSPDKISAPAQPTPTPPTGVTVKTLNTEETMQNAAKQIAKIFTERYGTYSTDNDFSNIKDVEVISSPDLWKILSERITNSPSGGEFVGVTTKAITAVITDWQINNATVEVGTIRTETKNYTTSSKNQTAIISLIKIGDNWLVDDIKWK